MLWKLQSEGSLHGGSLGHTAVHRAFIMLPRNYSPDEKLSSGEWNCSFRIFWDRDRILNLTAIHTSATICTVCQCGLVWSKFCGMSGYSVLDLW
jgi:hypothetical protein